tara:strand:+ start:183 stop:449 length:267 start_codon:yes stop_codon:yes gene_type:complete
MGSSIIMDILNPQITIRKSGWLGKFFRGEYTVSFTYAEEYYTTTRWRCEERARCYGADTHADALLFAQKIKLRITGSSVHVYDETVED